jgi:hypothetical protein
MMQGRVNQRCEATLGIAVRNNETTQMVDASISSGFPKGVGFLGHPSRLLHPVGTDSAN